MRSTFKVMFYINASKAKGGFAPIMGRVTVNGQVAQFSCKQSVPLALWDAKGNRARGKGDEVQKINHALDKIKARIIELYNQIRERENFATAEMVRNAYQGVGNEYECLLTAFDKHLADFKLRTGKDRKLSTYNKLSIVRRHLGEFIRSHYKRRDIATKELTEEFIRGFDIYLRTEIGLAQTTIWLYLAPLEGIVTRAHMNGHLHLNPFAQYRVSPNVKERQFLTEDELQRVMNIPLASRPMARGIFVFCALTGISFVDTKNLTEENLVQIGGAWWISSRRQKTGVPFRVKLLDSAMEIIERYEPMRRDGHLFDFPDNQQTNIKLRRIIAACGIEKAITWHQARHNFGTHITLSMGVSIGAVQRMMGHERGSTTEIYAKVTDRKIEEDMRRLRARTAGETVSLHENEELRAAIRFPGAKKQSINA